MKLLLALLALLPIIGFSQQATQVNRSNGYNVMNDPKLKASQVLYIPIGTNPSLNGGPDTVGALYYHTGQSKLYQYEGNNIWRPVARDVVVVNGDVDSAYLNTTKDTLFIPRQPIGQTGQVNYIKADNSSRLEAGDLLNIGKFVYDDLQLDSMKTTLAGQRDIFNRWRRFAHGGVSGSGNEQSGQLTDTIPDRTDATNSFIYDADNDIVKSTYNTGSYVGFYNNIFSTKYSIAASLSSSGADNDKVGLVIAFIEDKNDLVRNNAYGLDPSTFNWPINTTDLLIPNQHTISVYRNRESTTEQYRVIYDAGKSDEALLTNGTSSLSYTPTTNWNSSFTETDLKVIRDGDDIYVYTTEFADAPGGKGALGHQIHFKLTDFPVLEKFRNGSFFGISARSQANAYWHNLAFSDNSLNIYDLRNGDVWTYNGSVYNIDPTLNTFVDVGIRRYWFNPYIGTFGYIRNDSSYNLIHDPTKTGGGGTGTGNPNTNTGGGYRWAIAGTNILKTLYPGTNIIIDSSSHTNALTISTTGDEVTDDELSAALLNYVTTNTTQTVPASKTWTNVQTFTNNVGIGAAPRFQFDVQNSTTTGAMYFDGKRLGLGWNGNMLAGSLAGGSLSDLAQDNTVFGSTALQRAVNNIRNTAFGGSSQGQAVGDFNTSIGPSTLFLTHGNHNTAVGNGASAAVQGERTTTLGSQASAAKIVDSTDINNSEIQLTTRRYSGSGTAAFISAQSLSIGQIYPFNIRWDGTAPEPYNTSLVGQIFANGTIINSNTIELDGTPFTTTGSGTTSFVLYNKQDNSIAIGYNVQTSASNEIAIGNTSNSLLKVNKFIVDITSVPATGDILTWTGSSAQWASASGGGPGSYSFATPLTETGGLVTVSNATTSSKGVSSFSPTDFDVNTANVTIDYANGQAASPSTKGFLSSADWIAFNGKQAPLQNTINIKSFNGQSILGSGNLTGGNSDSLSGKPGSAYEAISNKSTTTTLGTSNTLYPTQNAVKVYTDNAVAGKVSTSTAINTTGPLLGGGALSGSLTLSIANAAADGVTKGAATFAASDFNATAGVISIDYASAPTANGSTKGFLSAADWNTFNSKIGISSPTLGDFVWYNGTSWARFPRGTAGQKISMVGTTPTWTDTLASTSINYNYSTLTDAATIALDGNNGINFKVTLGGNRTLAVSNIVVGKVYTIEVKQDATGGRHLTLPANSKVANGYGSGTSIILSTAPGATDYISFKYNGTNYFWTPSLDFQ